MEDELGKTMQVTLKIPTNFLKDFDALAGQLGYSRNEAIREAMRRFSDSMFQTFNQRHPERGMQLASTMIGGIFTSVAEGIQRLEDQTKALPNKKNEQTHTVGQ